MVIKYKLLVLHKDFLLKIKEFLVKIFLFRDVTEARPRQLGCKGTNKRGSDKKNIYLFEKKHISFFSKRSSIFSKTYTFFVKRIEFCF